MKFILHILLILFFLFQFTQVSYTQTTTSNTTQTTTSNTTQTTAVASNTTVAASTTGMTNIIENLN